MPLVIQPSPAHAAQRAASAVADRIRLHPTLVIGLATGRTMIPVFAELAAIHRRERLSFADVTVFALDEYLGASPAHPGSCRAFLDRHLLGRVDVTPARVHLLRGEADNPGEECRRYEQTIAERGGIDLQLLGLGRNGHIGFNEPGSSFESRARVVPLSASTRAANADDWGAADAVPAYALTLGIATILEARACLLLAFGVGKAAAVAGALEGPVSLGCPASALRAHADATFIVDEAAASLLRNPH